MPFGLTNTPATFQQLMQSYLGNLHLHYCIIYLDDVIVFFPKTLGEHLLRFRAVFEKLKQAELKLKPSKCEFFKQELTYLGHVVSKSGIQANPKKVKAISKWPVATNVTEVRSFLGFTKYYQRFIKKYAQVAKSLYKIILGENASKNRTLLNGILNVKKPLINSKNCVPLHQFWLMLILIFKLLTNASVLGLEAVLYQVQDGVEKVISYFQLIPNQVQNQIPSS